MPEIPSEREGYLCWNCTKILVADYLRRFKNWLSGAN
jgi:hypothetical protein